MVYRLLDPDGHEQDSPHAQVLAGADLTSGRFLSCVQLGGAVLGFPGPTEIQSVRALFFAGGQTDTLNSWIRSLRLPPPGALRLSDMPAEERRFQVSIGGAALGPDAVLLELWLPAPVRLEQLKVLLTPGPWGWLRLDVAAEPYTGEPWSVAEARDLPSYPPPQERLPARGDPLTEQLLARGEPSLADVWRLAQPYRAPALIGVVEGPIAAIGWDGGAVLERHDGDCDRLWLRLEVPGVTAPGAYVEQALLEGWRPVSQVTAEASGLRLRQEAFIGADQALHLRWELRNTGAAAVPVPAAALVAAKSRLQKADNDRRALAALHQAVEVRGAVAGPGAEAPRVVDILYGGLQGELRGGWPASLGPDEAASLELRLPLEPTKDVAVHDPALAALRAETDQYIAAGATLDLPDPFLQKLWRGLLCHNRLFQRGGKMRYGLFPGVYQDGLFGVEEGWNLLALAMFGHGAEAHALLKTTFFDAEFLKKDGQHHQYRNGLALFYALEVLRLTGDRAALAALSPTIRDSAGWIRDSLRSTRVEVAGARPPYFGLMPRHTYGGDLSEPAYSLYSSSACWRGLRDGALLLAALDPADAAESDALLEEAARARRDMWHAAATVFRSGASPPYLPFRADVPGEGLTEPPTEGDYYQLFSSLILETALFGWRGRMSRAITDYLTETGRLVLGVARFDQWFGRLGVDAEYSRGVQLAHLQRRDFDSFYLGMLGQIGLSCDPDTLVSPETAIVRFSRQDHQDRLWELRRNPRRYESDPCSAGTAVMLHYLRYLLVLEERDEEDLPTGRLLIGAGAPRSWFQPGQRFGAQDLPTAAGVLSLRCHSEPRRVVYDLSLAAAGPVQVEVFYHDEDGRHLSQVVEVQTQAQVVLQR